MTILAGHQTCDTDLEKVSENQVLFHISLFYLYMSAILGDSITQWESHIH